MSDHPDLTDQVAVVTGASRGIGRSIARQIGSCGATIVPCARNEKELTSLSEELKQEGGNVFPVPVDLAQEQSIIHLFDCIREKFGRLDVLVNNAGTGSYGDTVSFSTEAFDQIMAVNVRGAFICCREALTLMQPRKSGYIINISSVVGFKAYPQQAAYTASKHALMGLTKSLAAEVQDDNIRVSAILPGGVETDLVTKARPDLDTSVLMQPDDVADGVLYLLSLSDRAAVDQIYIRRKTSTPFWR